MAIPEDATTSRSRIRQRAYCSSWHPGSDAEADRWCEVYHTPPDKAVR